MVNAGIGKHVAALSPSDFTRVRKLALVNYVLFAVGTSACRASALFFYARVFDMIQSLFRYVLYVVHGLNAMWMVGVILFTFLRCNPPRKTWEPRIPGTCVNIWVFWMVNNVPALVLDLTILLLPMPLLWNLHLRRSRKLLIMGVFACGYLVLVVTVGRLVTFSKIGPQLQNDPTYEIAKPVYWLSSEMPIAIVSVSLPAIFFQARRLYQKSWRFVKGSIQNSTSRLGSTARGRSQRDTN
ncbi:hypothetical protein BO71DRAFT_355471, partial [Aspergillus ellipticus CBS 707.79]